jgi:hypothetical protein
MSLQEHTYDSGLDRKERGMKQATKGNKAWRDNAIAVVKALPVGWKGTGESIRFAVGALPSHPNAWGALVNTLIKEELIYPTGDYSAMKDKTSNGRRTPVYERM